MFASTPGESRTARQSVASAVAQLPTCAGVRFAVAQTAWAGARSTCLVAASAHIFMLWQYTLLAGFVCLHFDFLCTLARPFTTQLLVSHVFHIWPGIPLLHLMWKFHS